ncbi:MAG: hypothetical protein ACI4HI_12550 [Lachnospiraceae bacterium]
MIQVDDETKGAIAVVEKKGTCFAVCGTTQSGKSTLLGALTDNMVVQKLLSLREAAGKGSTREACITVTDFEKIPEGTLIMDFKMKKKNMADCNDDNSFLTDLIYSGADIYSKKSDADSYYSEISKTLKCALERPSNESLAYKIKDMTKDDIENIMKIIKKFPIDEVMNVFNESQAIAKKKGQVIVKLFKEVFSKTASFESYIIDFWDVVVNIINRDMQKLEGTLRGCGAADVETLQEDEHRFIVFLDKDDVNSTLVKVLLKSEFGSKEYLFSDVQLIFRGAKYVFNVEQSEQFVVAELDGKEIHCVRFIDTQGLFHATGASICGEATRIIDILAKHHCDKILFVVNSKTTDTVKKGFEAERRMLQNANRDLQVYILYTHWDEYLKDYLKDYLDTYYQNNTFENERFGRGNKSIEWDKIYEYAVAEQEEISQMFEESIKSNTSKKKPTIIGKYRAAFLLNSESKMEDFLGDREIFYPKALHKLLQDMVKKDSENGRKYKVFNGIDKCFSIETAAYEKQNIKALYENLVVECKHLKLYSSTVRACVSKWCYAGEPHRSDIFVNDYGYENINTEFVREIRNYAMKCLDKVKFNVEGYLHKDFDGNEFMSDLMSFLSLYQNVGREVSKMIGLEAYREGFYKEKGYRYQYSRFMDMLQYTQDTYFQASSIMFTEKFKKCLENAIIKCINNFVDSKCIVVY